MKLGKDEVEKVAVLARLSLSPKECEKYAAQLSQILEYVEQLNELDTSKVEPTSHAVDMPTPVREDVNQPCLTQEEALANAPQRFQGGVKVPRVIDN